MKLTITIAKFKSQESYEAWRSEAPYRGDMFDAKLYEQRLTGFQVIPGALKGYYDSPELPELAVTNYLFTKYNAEFIDVKTVTVDLPGV